MTFNAKIRLERLSVGSLECGAIGGVVVVPLADVSLAVAEPEALASLGLVGNRFG